MIRSDNHVHTVFSSDSEEPLEQMLTQAVEIGLSSICITDHMDYVFRLGNGMNFEFDLGLICGLTASPAEISKFGNQTGC